ncbi:hypothetical protein BBO99_00008019, partial [Phytophthora kernoviae]
MANRIPPEKVHIQNLLNRGAFGEVYSGTFNNEQVAVKMLLPSTRRDIRLVNEFLEEVRLTVSMDHPRIVILIGVAWDSLSDLCVVLEFMEGGDLRAMLKRYEKARHPVGFDHKKTAIALYVCHALAYLHSLGPPGLSGTPRPDDDGRGGHFVVDGPRSDDRREAKQQIQRTHGRHMTDATFPQQVAMGSVNVEFSNIGPQSMMELGC